MHALDPKLPSNVETLRIDRVRADWGAMPVKLVFSYGKVDTFPFIIVRLWSGPHCGMGKVLVPYTEFLDQLSRRLLGADARRLDALLPPEVFAPDAPGGDHVRSNWNGLAAAAPAGVMGRTFTRGES